MSRTLDIGNKFTALGGSYSIVNLYYKNGIAYIYVERVMDAPDPVFTLEIKGDTTSIHSGDHLQLTVLARKDSEIISNPTILWESSDTSIATITDGGMSHS